MGRLLRILVPAVVVLAALAGCGGDDEPKADTDGEGDAAEAESETTTATAPVKKVGPLAVFQPQEGADESGALVRGTLAIEGDCVHLSAEGGRLLGVVWPIGTEWDASEGAVRLPDGTSFQNRDPLSGGGLFQAIDYAAFWTSIVDPQCTEDVTEVAVFNRYAPVRAPAG